MSPTALAIGISGSWMSTAPTRATSPTAPNWICGPPGPPMAGRSPSSPTDRDRATSSSWIWRAATTPISRPAEPGTRARPGRLCCRRLRCSCSRGHGSSRCSYRAEAAAAPPAPGRSRSLLGHQKHPADPGCATPAFGNTLYASLAYTNVKFSTTVVRKRRG